MQRLAPTDPTDAAKDPPLAPMTSLSVSSDTAREPQWKSRDGDRATIPRRILYLDHTATLGGGEIALLNLVTHLDRGRYEPIVLLCSDGFLADRLRDHGIETHVLPLSPSIVRTRKDSLGGRTLLRVRDAACAGAYVLRIARFMREHKIDLIHTNSLKADVLGGLAGRLARIPILWHVRDRIEEDYLPEPVVRVFRLLCRTLPHQVVANSRATLATLKLRNEGRGCAIYSGIELGGRGGVVYDGVRRNERTTTNENAVREDPPYPHSTWYKRFGTGAAIGLVGRISPWKGQHVFIEAAARLREDFPRAKFFIIGAPLFGEEAYDRELRETVRMRGLDNCVEFTGFRSDISQAIADLDILVHASTTGEPFGQVVVEGMAAGKPVVATNGGGVPEIVRDGETGLLVPMGDSGAIAGALAYLLENPDEALRMGAAGRERARETFSIEQTVRSVEMVYDSMLRPASRKASPLRAGLPDPVD